MIRIAAAGDVHFDKKSEGRLCSHFEILEKSADFFLLAGDLTQTGKIEEAQALAQDLQDCPVPVIAVLGNHDYNFGCAESIEEILSDVGVHVLNRKSITFEIDSFKVGVAGAKGFCGGYLGACGSEFGEIEMKVFIHATKTEANALYQSLVDLKDIDYKIALLHYSPIPDTLLGEKKEIYPFLGSYLLAEAIDEGGADIVFHGHAHKGTEKGATPGGIPVRNVAQPVIRHAFNVYTLDKATMGITQALDRHP